MALACNADGERDSAAIGWKLAPTEDRKCPLGASLNIYHVLEVNPGKFPQVNATGGKAFADFLVAKETQEIIRTFGVEKFGQPLFFPDAGKREEALRTESRGPRG